MENVPDGKLKVNPDVSAQLRGDFDVNFQLWERTSKSPRLDRQAASVSFRGILIGMMETTKLLLGEEHHLTAYMVTKLKQES